MKPTVVDFETEWSEEISVTTLDVPNYVAASEAYIVSIVDDDTEFCGTIDQARRAFGDSFWTDSGRQFYAANSNFDQGWEEKYFPPTTHPWQCILDIGVGNQLPRDLANLSRVVLNQPVDKSIRDGMKGVRWSDLPEEKQQGLIDYCLNDSVQEMKLLKALPPLSPVEARVAAHTRLINRRGVYIDTERVERDVERLHRMHHTAHHKIPWRHECEGVEGLLSPKKFATYCNSRGLPVPKSRDKKNADCTNLMSDHPELKALIEEIRRFTTSNALLKKAATLKARLTPDNRLPLNLLYCGAPHTKRWSAQGWNIQNLAKEPFFGDTVLGPDGKPDMDKSEWVYLRNWLVPAPGKKFLIFDLGQIEPRCLNWLVGNDEMLAMVRAGFKIYEAYALAFKNWKGAPGTLKKADAKFYANCKAEVLGLGFGMGGAKYIDKAAEEGIILTLEESKKIVQTFRKNNPKIPAFWGMLDNMMKKAMLSPDRCLQIEMPNGSLLRHFHIRQTRKVTEDGETRMSYMSSKTRGDFNNVVYNLWGGLLCENVTQRMARDIFAEAVLRVEDSGVLVRFHSHDECILEVDDGSPKFLEDQKNEIERIMTIAPDWCPDLPLAVEGSYEDRYCK